MIASNTGQSAWSRMPRVPGKIVWVVGAQKLVKDLDEGMKRIYEYDLPSKQNTCGSSITWVPGVNKVLIVNREIRPNRITMIIVKEELGY